MKCNRLVALVPIAMVSMMLGVAAFAGSDRQPAQAGQTFRDCSDCPEMTVLPAGSFFMGSSIEETARDIEATVPKDEVGHARQSTTFEHPQHLVEIGQPFALGKYRVTKAEFAIFVRETGYSTGGGCTIWLDHTFPVRADASWENPGFTQTDRDPVVCINWNDAKAYIAWLNSKVPTIPRAKDGPYRLPSEVEWEYAARAGTRTSRWWGDAIGPGNADCDGCGSQWDKKQPAPAGSFQTNPLSLSDILGGAWELMEDCWNDSYIGAPKDGSAWTTGACNLRVIRGGAWINHPWVLRSALRSRSNLNRRGNYIGFRVAKTLP
jgi:formylglycine-generating enzyme required for sulfatase activity